MVKCCLPSALGDFVLMVAYKHIWFLPATDVVYEPDGIMRMEWEVRNDIPKKKNKNFG